MRIFLLSREIKEEYLLTKKEEHYLHSVLRIEDGATFTAKDTKENYYNAVLRASSLLLTKTENKEENLLDNLPEYKKEFFPLDVYISILKGKKNELVCRALTEIGVRKISFVLSENCEKKAFSAHEKERIEEIVKEAVQQSGGRMPELEFLTPFVSAIKNAKGKKLVFHQSLLEGSKKLSSLCTKDELSISVFVGPEGGFSEKECKSAKENGASFVLLNTNILRSETASVYAVASIQSFYQNWCLHKKEYRHNFLTPEFKKPSNINYKIHKMRG